MGASVLITSTTNRIQDRVRELRTTGAEVVGIPGDLTDPATASGLVGVALEQWGRLDVVVQNAGMISISNPKLALLKTWITRYGEPACLEISTPPSSSLRPVYR